MNKKITAITGLLIGCQSVWTNDSYVRDNPGYCATPPAVAAQPAPAYDRELTGCTKEELIGAIKDAKSRSSGTAYRLALRTGCVYELDTVDNYWYGPNGLPEIDFALDIEGRGATIRRRNAGTCSEAGTPPFRLFYVAGALSPGLASGSLTLRNLTLAGGFSYGTAGGAALVTDPTRGDGYYGGGGGSAGLGGALFVHGSVVLSAVSIVDSCAQGGMGGLGIADRSYPGGGGGGLGGAGGAPVAGNPDNTNANKYGGGGGGFRSSGESASQGGVFLVGNPGGDTPAGAYGPGISAVPLKAAEPEPVVRWNSGSEETTPLVPSGGVTRDIPGPRPPKYPDFTPEN
ncbi:MAG TPA: hypothetical protein PKI03_37950, partial [Pseudomonadota bacterium]|nr:hypothetical protein [Pseudomonadota bacterium]